MTLKWFRSNPLENFNFDNTITNGPQTSDVSFFILN